MEEDPDLSSEENDAIGGYLRLAKRPLSVSPEKAARVLDPSDVVGAHVQKRLAQSTDATRFSSTYYEAAIPPPTAGFSSWCMWCGLHVMTTHGTVAPDDKEAAPCHCKCVQCSGNRDACRNGGCRGFFADEAVLKDFQSQAGGLPSFRRAVRDSVLKAYNERSRVIFQELHKWKTATRPTAAKTPSAAEAASKAVCVICHVEFLPRCGFAGLCGACRVYPDINQHLVRLGTRNRAAASDSPARDATSVPEESYKTQVAPQRLGSPVQERKCGRASSDDERFRARHRPRRPRLQESE